MWWDDSARAEKNVTRACLPSLCTALVNAIPHNPRNKSIKDLSMADKLLIVGHLQER
jgi:hypothetical protein